MAAKIRSDFVRGLCRFCGGRRVVGVEVYCGCSGSLNARGYTPTPSPAHRVAKTR